MHRLSKSQKLVYDMDKYAGGSTSVICGSMLIEGIRKQNELLAAINSLYRINAALRTRILETDGEPVQSVLDYVERTVEVLRFENKADLDQYAETYAKIPVDLYGDLCEIKVVLLPNHCGFLIKLHHIIGDAWALSLICTQFITLLNGETPQAFSYIEHLENESAYLQSDRYAKDRAFFLAQFKKCDEVTYLSEKQSNSFISARKTFIIDTDKTTQITDYAKRNNTSAFVLFMAATSAYISRIKMNTEKFYIGTAVLNRSGVREKNTVGMFVDTAPILIELDSTKSFSENLSAVKDSSFAVFRHQKFNYGDVLSGIRQEYGFTEKLYDVMVSYQNATIAGARAESTWYHNEAQAESLQIHIDDRDGEGIFRIHFDYQTDKFTEQEIECIYSHVTNLLFDAINNDGKPLYALEMLSTDEKQKLLYDFNDTSVDYPKDKYIHQLFEEQVERIPDKMAVIACDRSLTYRELNEHSNRIANGLIEQGVRPGDIVAFMLPRRSYLIGAILGILKAGAAYLPIDPDYPRDRIHYILGDSKASYFITKENIGELLANTNSENPCVALSSDSPSYCIYTSGTTGTPKGAIIRHKNLVNFCSDNIYNNLQHSIAQKCNVVLACGSIVFDISNFEIILSLLLNKSIILANEADVFDANLLADLISQNKIDCIHCTPTKLRTYLDNSKFALAFSNLKCIMVGGEQLTEDIYRLITKYSQALVFNGYGPTETTMGVSFGQDYQSGISIGKPIANTQIYIVDHYLKPLPAGVTGELCIAGDGVGAGYLNRPELTAEKFIDNPFGQGKLYKTGDLAYWREDGNIVYVGRNDFQVKIRGLRIELGEIENAISTVEGVSQAVVVVRKDETGRQFICAFYTENAFVPIEQIRSALRKKLPRYMIPHVFTRLVSLPMTSSGKVNRNALPVVDLTALETEVEYIAPKTPSEIAIIASVQDVLGIEKVSLLDNFFDLGGDSLKAIELIASLEDAGFHIDTKTIFSCETMMELATALEVAAPIEDEIVPSGDIPATAAQLRVYTAQEMQGGTAYNVPYVFRAKSIDPERLRRAVEQLIDRHEILRTRFENREGKIMQITEDSVPFTLECLDNADISTFVRPFDLSKAPLIRVGYYENTVMVDMHHIITDGGSVAVFFRELNELYMGRTLPDAPVQYRAFAARQQDMSNHESYWLSVYREELPELTINTDFKRGQRQSFHGKAVYDSIDFGLHEKVLVKCKTLNITPYVFYLGGFYVLLSKFSGNEDIAIGTPASGREGKFLNTLGMFVNTLAIRNKPEGEKSVQNFLLEVKESALAALEHQVYPYGDLVKRLGLKSQGRNPLFDMMFAYQDDTMTAVAFGDEPTELLPIPVTTSKYDITFNVLPRQGDVVVMVEYCTDLYGEQSIRRFLNGYRLILSQMLDEKQYLKEISAISEDEKHTLLVAFNDTATDYLRDKCVHQVFEEQVRKTPDKPAVIACDKTLTYGELNEAANRIANSLIERGIKPGDIVAFMLPRRSYLLAAMFGILKTGAVYLPIDLNQPQSRIDYMLTDSGAKLLLTDELVTELLENKDTIDPIVPITSDNQCYCIYTSGSTGKPKGIVQTHRNVVNFIWANNKSVFQQTLLNDTDYVVSCNSVSFDITLQEIHFPLLNGLVVIFLDENQIYNIGNATHLFNSKKCGLIITPTKLELYMANPDFCKALKTFSVIMCGAETFFPKLYQTLRTYTSATIFNGYGPTETTCGVSYGKITSNDITIGKPIANTQFYIVDRYMQPVPLGVTGELCIAGDGVGTGYLNRPELTAEKFIDNPFGEGKLYKTGDLAYWREDGNIVYIGRNDFQVKIRGLRIELGEIENALQGVLGITQSVVTVRSDGNGRQLICAFYTGQEMDGKTIRAAIGQKLPKYMLPHSFTHLNEFPLTSSGKINRKALPDIDLSRIASDVEYVRPTGKMELKLSAIMEDVLEYSPIGMDDDFFGLGGDSLKAIEFVSEAHNEGIYFSLQSIFDHPTVRQLAEHIKSGNQQTVSFSDVDFTEVNKILGKNKIDFISIPQRAKIGNLLLTGATGYLGIHILAEFIKNEDGFVYCLVRGKNQEDSKQRLDSLLNFYFGDRYADCGRIKVLCADLQKERFGLSEQEYMALVPAIGVVINSAASVKHYGSYQYFKEANIDTTARIIRFCQAGGARLLHISTLSVSGNSFDTFDGYVSQEEKHFHESDLYIGQPLENVYARSKFEAERMVLEAMSGGLQANILRMGNLTSRLSDGVFQKNYESNAFLKRVKSMLELGVIPDYLLPHHIGFTPIDEAANAVMTIASHFNTQQTVFHISSSKLFHVGKLVEDCRELGFPLRVVSGKEFTVELQRTMEESGMKHVFETFITDLDSDGQLTYDSRIRLKSDFTGEYLNRLGFVWSELGIEYLRKYFKYLVEIGYLQGGKQDV